MSDIHPIYSDPDFDAWYTVEPVEGGGSMNFFHLYVYYWSPKTLQKMLTMWRLFREHVPQVFFAMGEVDDPKYTKFLSHFGFKYLQHVECTDGKVRRLFMTEVPNLGRFQEAGNDGSGQ
jgi:hypothetical protein